MSDEGVAARLIAVIREQSGLTQAELARRAGLTSSVLSAYARGRRQPGVDALARIATAAGLGIGVQSGDGVSDSGFSAGEPEGRAAGPRRTAAAERMARTSAGPRQTVAAERMARTRAAWARGADEGRRLDRVRALRLSPDERIEEGLALTRIAARLQAGRSAA